MKASTGCQSSPGHSLSLHDSVCESSSVGEWESLGPQEGRGGGAGGEVEEVGRS